MKRDLLTGELVRLTAITVKELSEGYARWSSNSEFTRLQDSEPSYIWPKDKSKAWFEKWEAKPWTENIHFGIRTLADDRLIGDIGLVEIQWTHGDAFVGVGIGEPSDWGKGYGTDAMRILLRYAFEELNLHRVTLDVFEYNPRAVRSYEKAGFQIEGRSRKFLNREGRRWDMIFMGILRSEWESRQKPG